MEVKVQVKGYVDPSPHQVLGCPSSELSKNMVAEEKDRVAQQAKDLGAGGLERKSEELKDAIAQNEVGSLK